MGIFSGCFGFLDTLTLAFSQDVAFEFRKASQDIKK
jgi:hypothetical protein